jgi:hypothetical protein
MVATTLATALSLQTGIRVYIHKKAKEYGTCKLAEGLVLISKFSSSINLTLLKYTDINPTPIYYEFIKQCPNKEGS